MVQQKISVNTDTLTIQLKDSLVHTADETQIAVLHLLHDGFSLPEIADFFGSKATDAVEALKQIGLDLDQPIELTAPGHILHKRSPPPERRMIGGGLANKAARRPDDIALILEQEDEELISISNAELHSVVRDIAGRLAGSKLGVGDHIALEATPSFEATAIAIAAWEVGLSIVIVRPTLSEAGVNQVTKVIRPKLWFGTTHFNLPATIRFVDLNSANPPQSFDTWLDEGDLSDEQPDHDPCREAVVMMSSGSTGEPKMLALSHQGLMRSVHYSSVTDQLDASSRITASSDMSAMSSLRIFAVMPAVSSTPTFIPLAASRESSLAMLMAMGQAEVTHARLVPATVRAIEQIGKDRVAQLSLKNLKSISSGGSALHERQRAAAADYLGIPVCDHFGMTETSGSFCRSDQDVLSSTGGLSHDILTRIVDENGHACSVGKVGRLRVFDSSLLLGQYTADGFKEREPGWFTSSDMALRAPNLNIILAGRSDNLLKTAEGEFLSPNRIVHEVLELSAVTDAVVLPSPLGQMSGVYFLFVQSDEDASEIEGEIKATLSKKIGSFGLPKRVFTLKSFPRIAQGKADLQALKAMTKLHDIDTD